MKDLELIAFEIISNVGTAKSLAIEAIRQAKEGKYDLAKEKLLQCNDFMINAHHSHTTLIQKEASGEKIEISLIIMHAEDQMLSAETIIVLANEMIEMYIELKK